jgi:hypothetical protein
MKPMMSVHTAFGLACDVQKARGQVNQFRAADGELSTGKKLFGDLRLEGFAALLKTGFAERLIVVGGAEARYKDEQIGRACAVREILLRDLGVDAERVEALHSEPSTSGNVAAVKRIVEERSLRSNDCAVVSSHYHLPRVHMDLWANDLLVPIFSAEAFSLLAREDPKERLIYKDQMIRRFGQGALAQRMVDEIGGIADKMRGIYGDLPKSPIA